MNSVDTNIYTKSTDFGDDKLVILKRNQRFVAQLDLGDWEVLQIGFFLSCTKPGEPNSNFTYSSSSHYNDETYRLMLGVFNSGDWVPGVNVPHGFYIGTREGYNISTSSNRVAISYPGPYTQFFAYDGVSSTYKQMANRYTYFGDYANAAGTTDFACFFTAKFTRNASDSVLAYDSLSSAVGDTSLERLREQMQNTGITGSVQTLAKVPVGDLNNVMIHWPVSEADLRIHAWRARVLK